MWFFSLVDQEHIKIREVENEFGLVLAKYRGEDVWTNWVLCLVQSEDFDQC